MAHAAALPVAGLIALVMVQAAILSANGELTLNSLAPMVWQAICFTGLIAVVMNWYQR